jgi:hypothetical protein
MPARRVMKRTLFMHWNYRVLRHEDGTLALHEVFYDEDGKPSMYTTEPISFAVDADEGLSALTESLERALRDAKERPVLDASEIGTKPKESGSPSRKTLHLFSDLTEDWSPDRRRRVEHTKAKHEQDIKATADEAAAGTDSPNWEELEAAVLERVMRESG